MPTTVRPCFTCKEVKPVEAFSPGHWKCKVCSAAYMRSRRQEDPELAWRLSLWHRFRITPERYSELLLHQNGTCAVCESPPRSARLHVDHDRRCCPGKRSCGQCVRGLLCYPCNGKLAVLESDAEYAKKLRAYAGVEVVPDAYDS